MWIGYIGGLSVWRHLSVGGGGIGKNPVGWIHLPSSSRIIRRLFDHTTALISVNPFIIHDLHWFGALVQYEGYGRLCNYYFFKHLFKTSFDAHLNCECDRTQNFKPQEKCDREQNDNYIRDLQYFIITIIPKGQQLNRTLPVYTIMVRLFSSSTLLYKGKVF